MSDPLDRDKFPDRPDHPDFWPLSEVILHHDGRTEEPNFDMAAETATIIDPDVLNYMLENRVMRFIGQRDPIAMITGKVPKQQFMQLGAVFLDAFHIGAKWMRRRMREQLIEVLQATADSLEEGHAERPGLIRAIELVRHYPKQ